MEKQIKVEISEANHSLDSSGECINLKILIPEFEDGRRLDLASMMRDLRNSKRAKLVLELK